MIANDGVRPLKGGQFKILAEHHLVYVAEQQAKEIDRIAEEAQDFFLKQSLQDKTFVRNK